MKILRSYLAIALTLATAAVGLAEEKPEKSVLDIRHSNNGFITVFDKPGVDGRELFNMMIPEYIKTGYQEAVPEDKKPVTSVFFYVQPSKWEKLEKNRLRMSQNYPEYIRFEVVLTPTEDALYLAWRIRNNKKEEVLKDLNGDFCTSCKALINSSVSPAVVVPKWAELVFKQVSVYSPSKKWRPYPDGGDHDALILACKSMDGKKLLVHASDRIGGGSHAFANTCIHHSAVVVKELAPGEWSPWQRRAVYLIEGTQEDVVARYEKDFSKTGKASDKWPE